tara:strand:+ start:58 stop:279 length:222 start_codon:yes stop_codon:yes gene_type:complete
MLKIKKTVTHEIVTDQGKPLPEHLEKLINYLMNSFIEAKVLGDQSPISPASALRMTEVALTAVVDFAKVSPND